MSAVPLTWEYPCGLQRADSANRGLLTKPWHSYNCFVLAVLGLRCCARAFSSCGEQGLLFIAVRGLLTAVASLVAEHGL